MGLVTVDIAQLRVSRNPDDVLITYALGSCIAVVLFDPVHIVGGMIHYMLPLSATSPDKARDNPAMFADTGIPLLFESMYKLGSSKQDLIVKVIGAGKFIGTGPSLDIGKRNYTVLRKMFWKNGVMIKAEDVGGSKSRTVKLQMSDGRVIIKSQGEETDL
jgi:chemotaxis protein CheD